MPSASSRSAAKPVRRPRRVPSLRSECVLQSEIRNMSGECEKVRGLNLSQGVCDTEVPVPVRRAAQQAIEKGINSYVRYDGLEELRQAIARKLRKFTGLRVDPETEVVVSAGATGAFYSACLALLNPGDEVILFEPYYGYHVSTLQACENKPRFVPLRAPDWLFRPEDLERARTPRTRAILINTPANPTGKVFTKPELGEIARFACKHDLFVFTDEIYEHFLYDGRTHINPATLPGMRERTISISGLSKTFSITGWRIGYAVGDARWLKPLGHFSDLIYVCAPSPLQAGVAHGLDTLGDDFYDHLSAEYAAKRDLICGALDRAGLTPHIPQGAYYVMADMSRIPGRNSKERAMRLLRDTGVACVPGEAFLTGTQGRTLARFCYAKKDDVLREACRRLERYRP